MRPRLSWEKLCTHVFLSYLFFNVCIDFHLIHNCNEYMYVFWFLSLFFSLSPYTSAIQKAMTEVKPTAKQEDVILVPNTTWDDIGGLDNIRKKLNLCIMVIYVILRGNPLERVVLNLLCRSQTLLVPVMFLRSSTA